MMVAAASPGVRIASPAEAKAILRGEMIVSLCVNAGLFPGLIRLAGLPPPQRLDGADGLVSGMLKGAGLAMFLMTLLLTIAVRARQRAGLPALDPARLPPPARALPRVLALRAVVVAIGSMLAIVPVSALLAYALRLLPFTMAEATLFNIGYGAVVALVVTPTVARRALADGAAR